MSFEENQNFDNNPILQPENYAKQYQENIDALKNQPAIIELDKLCYEVFLKFEPGKRLLEVMKERWLIPALAAKGSANYEQDVIWGEGFKELIRFFLSSIIAHEQRIQAGK